MRYVYLPLLPAVLFFGFSKTVSAQHDDPLYPSIIGHGVFHGVTPPLRELPAMTAREFEEMGEKREKRRELNPKLEYRSYPFEATALPRGPDPAWQQEMGRSGGAVRAPLVNVEGQQVTLYAPSDPNGTAGPNHYMQTVNSTYAIYNKSGSLVAGPTNMNLLFSGVTGATCNDGDPLILYDEQAARWLAVEFSLCGANDYMLVAVSQTNDPTGSWYKYSFDVADLPDYEKFGIWHEQWQRERYLCLPAVGDACRRREPIVCRI